MAVLASLGAQICRNRKARGWTQDKLAELLQVDRTTAGRWERDLAEPSPANIRRLLKLGVLDRQMSELLTVGSAPVSKYKWYLSISAPRRLLNSGCRFRLLHVCNGRERGGLTRYLNRIVEFESFGDRGELRAAIQSNENTGFSFKCFVEFATLPYDQVAAELQRFGFVDPTVGDGKIRRAWFLLDGYDVVGKHRNNYYFPE